MPRRHLERNTQRNDGGWRRCVAGEAFLLFLWRLFFSRHRKKKISAPCGHSPLLQTKPIITVFYLFSYLKETRTAVRADVLSHALARVTQQRPIGRLQFFSRDISVSPQLAWNLDGDVAEIRTRFHPQPLPNGRGASMRWRSTMHHPHKRQCRSEGPGARTHHVNTETTHMTRLRREVQTRQCDGDSRVPDSLLYVVIWLQPGPSKAVPGCNNGTEALGACREAGLLPSGLLGAGSSGKPSPWIKSPVEEKKTIFQRVGVTLEHCFPPLTV